MQGEYYHLYNRGNSKQKIFHDARDYSRFISLLYISNSKDNFNLYDLERNADFNVYDLDRRETLVSIGAFCLMPNHFHVLVREKIDGGISRFMQKLGTAYSMYYNKKYQRSGALFEGKFKSRHLDMDRYLKYIFAYIHLNPTKLIQRDWKERGIKNVQQALKYLKEYPYSSYKDFVGEKRVQVKILDVKVFPRYFPDKVSFKREILDWLTYDNDKNLR